jgi:hypothetical protein
MPALVADERGFVGALALQPDGHRNGGSWLT